MLTSRHDPIPMRTPPPSPLAFVAFLAVASAFARTLACPGLRTARQRHRHLIVENAAVPAPGDLPRD